MISPSALARRPLMDAQHPVVFFANGIGDTILSLPALRALAELFPRRMTLVCDKPVFAFLSNELAFRRVVDTKMERNVPDWTREFHVPGVADEIGKCDLFISLVPWHSQSLKKLLQKLKPENSIGFFQDFHMRVSLDFQKHAADLAFDIPKQFDGSLRLEDYASPLRLSPEGHRVAQTILELIPPAVRILAVHADTGRNKMWPAERFVQLLDSFLERHPEFLVLVVGGSPQPLDRGRNAQHVIPCYGLALDASFCLVGHADIFLGVDSCMLHAADLYRIPSVGLFGASSPVEFGFRLAEGCRVCKGRSMESIDVAQVLDALEAVLAQN